MRDVLLDYEKLAASGEPVGRAVVISVWGSAPRPEGACLLATPSGVIAGSVSGGCVEAAAALGIAEAIERGTSRLLTFGVSHEKAWEVGLACGGTIKVFVQPAVPPTVLNAARSAEGRVVATVLSGPLAGASAEIREDGSLGALAAPTGSAPADAPGLTRRLAQMAPAWADAALEALLNATSRSLESVEGAGQPAEVFLEVFPRRPKLLIFGGVHIAMALVALAKPLGYRTIVADGRGAFITRERFPEADELILDWPEGAFARVGLDAATYVCILSHDPKFDEPALRLALRSPARYIGAIGSRKTQAERRERLKAQGFSEADLARVRGPIGLDLGGRQPAETALAILAEMTMARYGRLLAAGPRSP